MQLCIVYETDLCAGHILHPSSKMEHALYEDGAELCKFLRCLQAFALAEQVEMRQRGCGRWSPPSLRKLSPGSPGAAKQ